MMNIREYCSDDLDAVLAVWEPSFRSAHPFLNDDFVAAVRRAIPEVYIPSSRTWVAEQGGGIVGFMSLLENEVGGLFVEPQHFGMGVGQALLHQACALHPTLDVEVFAENARAVRFYRRFGFREHARREHDETGFVLIRMRLASVDAQTE